MSTSLFSGKEVEDFPQSAQAVLNALYEGRNVTTIRDKITTLRSFIKGDAGEWGSDEDTLRGCEFSYLTQIGVI